MKVLNKQHMQQVSNQGSVFTKVEEGEMRVRVIGDIHVVKEHQLKIDGKFRAIACPTENARLTMMTGENQSTEIPPCPLCELQYPLKTSYLAMIVEREYSDKNGKLKGGEASVLKKGSTLLGEIQNLFDDENWGREGNYDIKITATGQGFDRKYSVLGIPANKSAELCPREEQSIKRLKEKVSLDEMTIPRPYDEIKEIIGDLGPHEDIKAEEIPF